MCLNSYVLEYFLGKKTREKYPNKNQDVNQIEAIILDYPFEQKYEKSLKALKLIKALVTNQDKDSGKIEAKTGFSLKSFGEKVEIKINPKTNEVLISSKPSVPTTLFDYGKNLENVQKILNYLKKI